MLFEYIVNIIFYTLDGYDNDIMNEHEITGKGIDDNKLFEELKKLIEVLKKLFYTN